MHHWLIKLREEHTIKRKILGGNISINVGCYQHVETKGMRITPLSPAMNQIASTHWPRSGASFEGPYCSAFKSSFFITAAL